MEKECSKCGEVKPYSEFSKSKDSKDGYQYRCKKCAKAYYKDNKYKIKEWWEAYYKDNKDKKKAYGKAYHQANKDKRKAQQKAYREANKDNLKSYSKSYYQDNKDNLKAQAKVYREANKDKIKVSRKAYREANRDKIKAYKKVYREANKDKINTDRKNRRKTDSLFRLRCNISSRTSMAIKNQGYTKKSKTHDILGIDYDRLVVYLERKFKKGMTWYNYGEWHIDHIIPLSSAKTEQELLKLCHYTNLQPLWAVDNLTKNNKIEETQILLRI